MENVKKVKIKALRPNVKSMKLNVPVDGVITIDADGCAMVSQKCAEILISKTKDWDYAGKASAKEKNPGKNEQKQPEGSQEGNEEEGDEDENEEGDEMTLEEMVEYIKKAKLKELIAMAEEAEYPVEEYKDIVAKAPAQATPLMRAYMTKKAEEVYAELEAEGDEDETEEEETT